jgi:hypothetical protein
MPEALTPFRIDIWRATEARLNALPQFKTDIDGLGIHLLHVRSPHADPLPLIITHGRPGSIVEFLKVIGPLNDPPAHGGDAADAFHVVCPSLPGYGFSDKPTEPGWTTERIARCWAELMARLGGLEVAVLQRLDPGRQGQARRSRRAFWRHRPRVPGVEIGSGNKLSHWGGPGFRRLDDLLPAPPPEFLVPDQRQATPVA